MHWRPVVLVCHHPGRAGGRANAWPSRSAALMRRWQTASQARQAARALRRSTSSATRRAGRGQPASARTVTTSVTYARVSRLLSAGLRARRHACMCMHAPCAGVWQPPALWPQHGIAQPLHTLWTQLA